MDANEVAYLLHSHGCFLQRLDELCRHHVSNVALLGLNNSADCHACRAADGKKFTIDAVPELPLVDCECRTGYGCRVIVIAGASARVRR